MLVWLGPEGRFDLVLEDGAPVAGEGAGEDMATGVDDLGDAHCCCDCLVVCCVCW